jgi:hypothetical protein
LTPYKTPWCILNIVWPFYFVVAYFVRPRASQSYLSVAAVVILAGPATFQSVKVNFYKYDDESEPYVYVQTFSDIMKITEKIMHLVNKDPSKYHMPIKLFMDSNWPLPWILGDFTRAYYYGAPRDVDPNGDLIICDQKYSLLVENQITKKYFKVDFRLRSAQEPAVAYFDAEIFKDQFPVDAPTVSPKPTEPLAPGQGLLAEYYSNAQWTGNPVIKKIVSQPEFNLQDPQRPLPAPFGIIYSGEIFFPTSGNQMFYLDSDDGSDLHIDGKLVVENLGPHAEQMRTGTMTFTKGWHPIKIRYNDFGGGMVLRLWWNNTSGFQQGIEPRFFRLTKENIKGGGTH